MAFQEQVIGLDDLERNLNKIAKMIGGEALTEALVAGAWDVAKQARKNAAAQGLRKTGDLIDSIRPIKMAQDRVDVQVGVIYGATHEFGYKGTVTERQRRFFWAMYIKTKEDMWKALALSKTYTIPARPYLRPAIDSQKLQSLKLVARTLYHKMQQVVS